MNGYDLIFENKKEFSDYYLNDDKESINYLPNFNTINIIVGANNSGKSRFIRKIMSISSYLKTNKLFYKEYKDLLMKFEQNKVHYYRHNRYVTKPFILNSSIRSEYEENINTTSKISQLSDINESLIDLKENIFPLNKSITKYYIPTLRSAHSLYNYKSPDKNNQVEKIESDVFEVTLNHYYNLEYLKVNVFTGVHLYKEILNSRNSKRDIREAFEKFESFVGNNFFEGKKIDIVAEFDKDESLKGNNYLEIISLHIEGESETRKFYELGDGVQALIILLYKIFMAEDESFIFIDEPELNLHPGMQRLFLEQITSNEDLQKKKLTYFITTHSNHFLDLTIQKENVSIYSFSSKLEEDGNKKFIIKNVNLGDNEVLKNLGVNNSSVFMANCSLWVEGISDRNYIKAFLKSYCDSIDVPYPKEDIDFAFFEYAGSNIDHYIFDDNTEKEEQKIIVNDINALSLSNKIFLLADSDNVKRSTTKGKRLVNLESLKSDNFIPRIIWGVREIENLLTNEVWNKVLINFCNKTLIEDDLGGIQQKIDDALLKIHSKDYSKEYIGEFLNKIRNDLGKVGSTYILNQSNYEVKKDNNFGTFKNKRHLSELILKENISWKIYSQNTEIEKLTKEIYDFITNK